MIESEPTFCDHVPIEKRIADFKEIILPDIELSTGGVVSMNQLLNARLTLDVGCGFGAYAQALSELKAKGKFIGVDPTQYTGKNGYDKYEALLHSDIRNEDILQQLRRYEFDIVISIGAPPDVVKFLAHNRNKFRVTPEGLVIVITDNPIKAEECPGFNLFKGTTPIDENILVAVGKT